VVSVQCAARLGPVQLRLLELGRSVGLELGGL